jgi:hypothetical protein
MPTAAYKFFGADNVHDAIAVGSPDETGTFTMAVAIVNADPDNVGIIRRRAGRTKVWTGVAPHSEFANGEIHVFVDQGVLYSFDSKKLIVSPILTLSSNNKMDYDDNAVGLMFSNEVDIGIIKAGVARFFDPPNDTVEIDGVVVPSFKEALPPGKFVEYYNGKTYVLTFEDGESWLYYTDGYDMAVDSRENYLHYPGRPTFLASLDNVLYVGTTKLTVVLVGSGIDEFDERLIAAYPAIPYMHVVTKGELFGPNTLQGNVVVWVSERGICMGDNSGNFLNLSQGEFSYLMGTEGTLVLREQNGFVQLLMVIRNTDKAYNAYVAKQIDVDSQSV